MFSFVVNFWDEVNNKETTEEGYVYGENYGDVAQNLTDYYGTDVIDMTLAQLEDDYIVVLNGK